MSLEKPWSAPFEAAIARLKDEWQAEIRRPESDSPDDFPLGFDSGIFTYPTLVADRDGHRVHITVAEYPLGGFIGPTDYEGGDLVHYLRVLLRQDGPFDLVVRHEHVLDKLKKAIGVECEPQTGDPEFDLKYFLVTTPGADTTWLTQRRLYRLIPELEPFAALRIGRKHIECSRLIGNASQVSADSIKTFTNKVLRLAKAVSS